MQNNIPIDLRNKQSFEESDIVFVNDLFVDEYTGGAELTTEALFGTSPYKTYKIKAKDLTQNHLAQGVQKIWVFFNFSHIDFNLIPLIVANCHYFIVEYDYKFCEYRSTELCQEVTKDSCGCDEKQYGKLVSAFFSGAEKIFWMSDKQKQLYQTRFPFLTDEKSIRLSSIFDVKDLELIERLRESRNNLNIKKEYVVLGSSSWIKGTDKTRAYLKEQNIDFVVLNGLPYSEMLRTLSEYSGLAFLPLGGDTCPRIVIEAKLLGLNIISNENVQHTTEPWWHNSIDEIESYLLNGHNRFWNQIKNFAERDVNLSGYTTTYNVVNSAYPWKESIKSLLGFCDEVVVMDGGSNDGTYEELIDWSKEEPKLVIKQIRRNWDDPKFALFDGQQKAAARTICSGDWCWQQDVDEIIHENDYSKIKQLVRQMPKTTKLLCLPVIEYWGGPEKVRLDINPWKWRLSRNDPQITHDIPLEHRRYDEHGNVFSIGSDGCDYVFVSNYQPVPNVNFYTPDLHATRLAALDGNDDALKAYQNYMNLVAQQLPCVHHYSWFDIKRKIYTYKNYWSKHWTSIYNKVIEDLPENNMFFDKKWSDVSDEEINQLADKMKNELGGWIFHTRVDFDKPTPWITLNDSHPSVIKSWLSKHTKQVSK